MMGVEATPVQPVMSAPVAEVNPVAVDMNSVQYASAPVQDMNQVQVPVAPVEPAVQRLL